MDYKNEILEIVAFVQEGLEEVLPNDADAGICISRFMVGIQAIRCRR